MLRSYAYPVLRTLPTRLNVTQNHAFLASRAIDSCANVLEMFACRSRLWRTHPGAVRLGLTRRHEAGAGVRLRCGAGRPEAHLDARPRLPATMLESHMKCPKCGSRRVRLAFGV